MPLLSSDGLALNGQAPRIFTKTSKNGLPWASVTFCSLFALISYMGISSGPGKGRLSLRGNHHIRLSNLYRVLSLRLVPEHDIYRRPDNMVWDLCRAYPLFHSLPRLEHIINTGPSPPPIPQRRLISDSEPAGTLKASIETSSHSNPPSNPTRHGTASSRSSSSSSSAAFPSSFGITGTRRTLSRIIFP